MVKISVDIILSYFKFRWEFSAKLQKSASSFALLTDSANVPHFTTLDDFQRIQYNIFGVIGVTINSSKSMCTNLFARWQLNCSISPRTWHTRSRMIVQKYFQQEEIRNFNKF